MRYDYDILLYYREVKRLIVEYKLCPHLSMQKDLYNQADFLLTVLEKDHKEKKKQIG